jgi:hypothetical protein
MASRKHRHTGYYTYMTPFLATGHTNVIDEAKKEWRRKYKADWRKQKRKQVKEITTAWTKEEYKTLKDEAKRHKQSVTRFIKESSVAYMDKRYITPHEAQVTKIMQLLALTYNSIIELKEDSTIPADAGRKVLFEIHELEREVRIALYSPKTIEQHITEYIQETPQTKERLIEFIQTLPV